MITWFLKLSPFQDLRSWNVSNATPLSYDCFWTKHFLNVLTQVTYCYFENFTFKFKKKKKDWNFHRQGTLWEWKFPNAVLNVPFDSPHKGCLLVFWNLKFIILLFKDRNLTLWTMGKFQTLLLPQFSFSTGLFPIWIFHLTAFTNVTYCDFETSNFNLKKKKDLNFSSTPKPNGNISNIRTAPTVKIIFQPK